MKRLLIIPAAGLGSRLKSDRPKPLTLVNGRPMLDHVIDRFRPAVDGLVVIAHPSFADALREHLGSSLGDRFAWQVLEQPSPTGMLDAILIAAPAVAAARPERVWITWCDQAGLLPETIENLVGSEAGTPPPDVVVATAKTPAPYTHLQRDAGGRIVRVLQRREGDRMPDQGESDAGLFSLSAAAYESLKEFAGAARQDDGTGERNFLPFIPWAAARGTVSTIECVDPREAIGINTPGELASIEAWLRQRSTAEAKSSRR